MKTTGDMPRRLVGMVRKFEEMSWQEREAEPGKALLATIHTVGRTAAFFGGWGAMKQLHDAAEELVGNDNSVGYWLNHMWDGIGGWMA